MVVHWSVTRSSTTTTRDLSVPAAVGVVTAISLAGSVVAVTTDLSPTWWDAVGPTGRLSVPLPMNAALLLLAGAASSDARPRLARGASWLVVAATSVAVVSGAFDGGYAAELTAPQRAVQVGLVLSLVGTAYVATRRARSAVLSPVGNRRRPA